MSASKPSDELVKSVAQTSLNLARCVADVDDAKSARVVLRAYALELAKRAADKHVEGINLTRHAARIEQFATIANDDQVMALKADLEKDGDLVVMPSMCSPGGAA